MWQRGGPEPLGSWRAWEKQCLHPSSRDVAVTHCYLCKSIPNKTPFIIYTVSGEFIISMPSIGTQHVTGSQARYRYNPARDYWVEELSVMPRHIKGHSISSAQIKLPRRWSWDVKNELLAQIRWGGSPLLALARMRDSLIYICTTGYKIWERW